MTWGSPAQIDLDVALRLFLSTITSSEKLMKNAQIWTHDLLTSRRVLCRSATTSYFKHSCFFQMNLKWKHFRSNFLSWRFPTFSWFLLLPSNSYSLIFAAPSQRPPTPHQRNWRTVKKNVWSQLSDFMRTPKKFDDVVVNNWMHLLTKWSQNQKSEAVVISKLESENCRFCN